MVFNVYKPAGESSFDVVRHWKRNLPPGFGKIGHFGTLDPFAEGILLIGIAGACKLSDLFHNLYSKTYIASGVLGEKSDTGDLTGEITKCSLSSTFESKNIIEWTTSEIESLFKESLEGDYMQVPPCYSASKHKGIPLYKWAREMGQEIKKDPVKRHIDSIKVLSFDSKEMTIAATVSTGTYIRTLFEDCAKLLGTCGYLKTLKRVKIGHIAVEDSIKKESWPYRDKKEFNQFNINEQGIPVDKFIPLLKVVLDQQASTKYSNGIPAKKPQGISLKEDEYCWVYSNTQKLLGLGRQNKDNIIKSVINYSHSS